MSSFSEVDIDRIKQFQTDDVSDYNAVLLETLTTLDFQMVTDSVDVLWSDGEPLIFDEEEDSALFKLTPEGLPCFLSNATELTKAGFEAEWGNSSPADYTWHHHEDKSTMQLVPEHIHGEFKHLGGFSLTNSAGN